ncbi:hypothetical protein M5K25_011374 [Dendrobium thyrsiflorum]|uniref:Uncharacterized protein n=1 Tax=Dendrobium thyrsiflorum TaxID=117978 RepID=A0ABD0V2L3_DENTH
MRKFHEHVVSLRHPAELGVQFNELDGDRGMVAETGEEDRCVDGSTGLEGREEGARFEERGEGLTVGSEAGGTEEREEEEGLVGREEGEGFDGGIEEGEFGAGGKEEKTAGEVGVADGRGGGGEGGEEGRGEEVELAAEDVGEDFGEAVASGAVVEELKNVTEIGRGELVANRGHAPALAGLLEVADWVGIGPCAFFSLTHFLRELC